MNRITHAIMRWNGQFRAEMYVDGHKVKQGFFRFRDDAETWCQLQRAELMQEVR